MLGDVSVAHIMFELGQIRFKVMKNVEDEDKIEPLY